MEKGGSSNGGTWRDAGAKGSLSGMSDLKTSLAHPKMVARSIAHCKFLSMLTIF